MKEELRAIGKGIPELACSLISIFCPQFAAASCVKDFIASVPNIIFVDKLNQVLSNGNENFFEWLKISPNFDEDSDKHADTVRKLIYTINSINQTELLEIYKNLMCAYQAGALGEDEFFRLGWALSNIFPDDLMYLKNCYGKKNMSDCPELRKLEQRGLVFISRAPTQFNAGTHFLYTISELGIKMLSCGIDYENHEKYQDGGSK